MASNTTLNTGIGGDVIATKERTHDGDATKVQVVTLAGVSGTEGAYTFGDIGGDATNGLDVDVTRIVPGTGATNLGKAEDGVHTSGDVGVMSLFVRQDTQSAFGGDGDYVPGSVDSTGNLRVRVTAGGIAGIVDDAAFTPATSEVLPVGFTFDDVTPDSVNEGDIGAARMSANRCIYVNVRDAAGNERGLNIDASGNLGIAANSAVNVAQMNGVTVTMGNGASGTGVQRVTLANDSTGVLATVSTVTTVTNITNQGHGADDSAFTPTTTRVMMAGYTADETATDSIDEGDMGAARITLDRKQIVTQYVHAAAGGATPYFNLDCDESEDDIKTSPGKLLWIHVMNLHASSTRYLKFYNATAANVTVGTTTPVLSFPVPANVAGFTINFGDAGVQFDTAISVAATTGFANNDTGAPGTNEVILNAGYA